MAVQNISAPVFPEDSFPLNYPFYYTPRASFFSGISDHTLSIVAPVIAHWLFAGLFHLLDVAQFAFIERYRLHDSKEVAARNLVSRWEVVRAGLFQQAIQVVLSIFWLSDEDGNVSPPSEMRLLAERMMNAIGTIVGRESAGVFMRATGPGLVYFMYWWGIPIFQFVCAM